MACQTIAKVLQRSAGRDAPPLTSMQLRYPLIVHAELMTHRVFSRNARSSRAVPTARLIEEVKNDPFVPRYWGANQKGMQASAECNEPVLLHDDEGGCFTRQGTREEAWLHARDRAVQAAQAFADAGYHKQVANRLLAPFLHIDVVLTATELDNWFALRDHEAAEPHIRDLARAMRAAIEDWDRDNGGPDILQPGEWHLPYVSDRDQADVKRIWDAALRANANLTDYARAVSVTRCAQVSYTPFHEAKLSVEQEVARHDALISARPCHASPLEHQATPDTRLPDGSWANPHLAGNLGPGWVQYRKMIPGERA